MSRGKKNNNKKNGKNCAKKEMLVIRKQISAPRPKARKPKAKKARTSKSIDSPMAASYAQSTQIRPFSQRSVTIRGCDLLATIAVNTGSSATTSSAVLGSVDLNPALLVPGGRLAQFAQLFDKYQYKELDIIYVPSVGTATSGCIQVIADPDILDNYSGLTGDPLNQAMAGAIHNVEIPIYQRGVLQVKDKRFFSQPLYINSDVTTADGKRWDSCGKVWWACMGPLAAATSYGRLMIRYNITFSEPSNDADSNAGQALIAISDNAMISSTYPWGDYTLAQANFSVGGPSVSLYNRPFCTFRSSATLGSVIQFNAVGYYTVVIYRTGAAMGTGAFSSAVFSPGVTITWPSGNSANLPDISQMNSGGGATFSVWITTIYCSIPGATISSTADSGVTHTASWTLVSKMNLSFALYTNSVIPSVESKLQAQIDRLITQVKAMSASPRPLIGPALSLTENATITIPDGSGGPTQTATVSLAGTVDNGNEPVNVVTPGFAVPKGWQLCPKAG